MTATSSHQSKVLSALHSLGPHPIACTPDALRNSSKGTTFAPHLCNSLPEDILACLERKRVPVTHVYRFPFRRNIEERSNPPFPPIVLHPISTHCTSPWFHPLLRTHLRSLPSTLL